MYLDVLTNYLQKFDDFINSIKEYQSNWEIEHSIIFLRSDFIYIFFSLK